VDIVKRLRIWGRRDILPESAKAYIDAAEASDVPPRRIIGAEIHALLFFFFAPLTRRKA